MEAPPNPVAVGGSRHHPPADRRSVHRLGPLGAARHGLQQRPGAPPRLGRVAPRRFRHRAQPGLSARSPRTCDVAQLPAGNRTGNGLHRSGRRNPGADRDDRLVRARAAQVRSPPARGDPGRRSLPDGLLLRPGRLQGDRDRDPAAGLHDRPAGGHPGPGCRSKMAQAGRPAARPAGRRRLHLQLPGPRFPGRGDRRLVDLGPGLPGQAEPGLGARLPATTARRGRIGSGAGFAGWYSLSSGRSASATPSPRSRPAMPSDRSRRSRPSACG